MNVDPFGVWFPVAIWHSSRLKFILSFFLRTFIPFLVVGELLKSNQAFRIVALIILGATREILARCKKVLEKNWDGSETRVITIYKELQLWNDFYNEYICYFTVPTQIFFGAGITIFTTFLAIRLPERVAWSIYWIFPMTSLVSLGVMINIWPETTSVYEESVSFLEYLRSRCYSKYERRLVRSLGRVGIIVGPFGKATKEWKTGVMWNILDYTINLLLTF